MGRKPKQLSEQVATNDSNSNNENGMVDVLMRQMAELQKQLLALQGSQNQSQPEVQPEVEEQSKPENYEKIDGREYIKIMSLSNIPLNLTTEPMGRGRLFQLLKFGEVKRVMYDDLVKIVYNHPTFTQSGRFIILNSSVVHELGYEEDYVKILDKKKIESILENKQNALDLYRSANEVQKKIIHEFLIRKVRDDLASVDMNLIVQIKQVSNIDIIAESEKIKKSVLDQSE
jgi:hypothetical protein